MYKSSIIILFFCLFHSLQAAVVWNIEYADVNLGNGVGFDDPTEGLARRQTLEAVTQYVSSKLNHTANIDLEVRESVNMGGPLASGGTFFPLANGFDAGLMHFHILNNFDPVPPLPDARITFDFFNFNWNTGLGTPGAGEFDLYTVLLHEVTHGLGWSSLVTEDGLSAINNTDPGSFSTYDSFLELGDGTALFGGAGEYLGSIADLTGNDVYFNGANAVAANGGAPVKVYAPSTWKDGSSMSHLHGSINSVMNPSIAPGVVQREFSDIDLGILADLGYNINTVAAVPEPSHYALFVLGLSLFLFRARKKKA